jgi:hypothetical protein
MFRTLVSFSVSLAVLLAGGCATGNTSTHHSLIRVSAPTATSGLPSQAVDFNALHGVVDAWAATSGMAPVPPAQAGQMHISWSTSNPNGNEQVLRYRDARPVDPKWPIELIVAYDPDRPYAAELSMGEGFGKTPSPRFRELYDSLTADVRARFGDRVDARIW